MTKILGRYSVALPAIPPGAGPSSRDMAGLQAYQNWKASVVQLGSDLAGTGTMQSRDAKGLEKALARLDENGNVTQEVLSFDFH